MRTPEVVLKSDTEEIGIPKTGTSDRLIKAVAKGGGIAFVGNIADKGITFLLHILLGRVLGTSGYGLYSLGYGLTMVVSQISMLGLATGIVRFVSLYKGVGDVKRVKGTLISAFLILSVSSILTGVLLFVFSNHISETFKTPQLSSVLKIFACALPLYVLMMTAAYSVRALQTIKYEVAIRNICRPMIDILIVSIAFLLGFRLLGAVCSFAVAAAISAVLGMYLLRRVFPEIFSDFKPLYDFKKLLRFSLPVLFVGFSYIILNQTDRIMLGYFMEAEDLGIYSASALIPLQAGLVPYCLSCIFGPIFSDLYNRNEFLELEKLYKTLTRWAVSMNLLLLILIILFSRQILGLFGPEFVSGWPILVVLSCFELIYIAGGAALPGTVLPMSGKQDIELANAVVMVTMNIVLNFWLIQKYGVLGAAIATGISTALVNIAKVIEVYILLGIHPYNLSYHKPFIAGVIVTLIFFFSSRLNIISGSYWILNVLLLTTAYFIILCLLGFEHEDKIVWSTVRDKILPRRENTDDL